MKKFNFIDKLKKIKKDDKYKSDIISETEDKILMSCCNGRMIRELDKKTPKQHVAVNLFKSSLKRDVTKTNIEQTTVKEKEHVEKEFSI